MSGFAGMSMGNMDATLKRPRMEITGFIPSPSEAVYLASPFMVEESNCNSPVLVQVSPRPGSDELADGKALIHDYLLLISTGHCAYESLSRGISQKLFVMSNSQRGVYFESLAYALRSYQGDPEVGGLLQKFCSGNLSNLPQHLSEAHMRVSKNIETATSSSPSVFGYGMKSPWTMITSNGAFGSHALNSVGLEDRKWNSPSMCTSSLSAEQSMDINNLQEMITSNGEDENRVIMDKTNARKKTLGALNRMKQFVVPSEGGTSRSNSPLVANSANGGQLSSPDLVSMSSLPQLPYGLGPTYPAPAAYCK